MPITLSRQQLSDLYRQSRGFGENALSMLTGGIGEPVAGFASLAALARGENATGARDAVRDAFTYSPRTAEGQGQQRMLGELAQSAMNSAPVRTWQRGVDFAGRASPAAGATLQTVPTALGALTGYKQAMQTGQAVSLALAQAQRVAMENAMTPRVLHPQRGVVNLGESEIDLFHGTSGYHTKFDDAYAGSVSSGDGRGFWFSKSPGYAWEYAENAAGKRGGLPRLARAKVIPGKIMTVHFDDFGHPVINGTTYSGMKSNYDVLQKAISEGYDSVDWPNGSFTDDPSFTVLSKDRARLSLDESDIDEMAEIIKRNKSVPSDFDSGIFDLSNIKKTKDGYIVDGYIYDDYGDAVDDYVDSAAEIAKGAIAK